MYRYDTRLLTCFQQLNRLTLLMPVVLLLAFGLSTAELSAQSSATPKNVYVPLTTDTYGDLEVTSSEVCLAFICSDDFDDLDHLTDGDLTNYAEYSMLVSILNEVWVQVTDNGATGGEMYPAGSYAGMVVESAGLLEFTLGETVRISTYDGTGEVEWREYESLVGLLDAITLLGDGTIGKIGFETTQPFNAIRITYGNVAGLALSRQVHYAEILIPDDTEAPDLGDSCNLEVPWVQSDGSEEGEGFPVVIELERTGADGASLSDITGLDNVVDSDLDNSANMYQILNLLGASSSISVRTLGDPLPGGTFAGYDVSTNVVLQIGLLNQVTVRTYLDGELL